jgi:uncharacterized protein YndB with AHSA1/START domain
MKWLLYILAGLAGLVVIAVVALLALGGGRGRGEYGTSVDIARPAPVVFAWITEPQRVKSWVGWLVDIKSLTPDTTGVGAREVWVMEDRNNYNQRMDILQEVIRHQPNRLIETRLDVPDGFTGTVVMELEPLGESRTRLTYRASIQYHHWLAKLMEPVISRSAQQKMVEDFERLRQKAEAD